MADILTSKIQVPSLPDDTLILKDAEARNDLSTSLTTATGNPLNFSTRSAQKANKTVISLEPIQDLHGYDYPWPAGGGKNKVDVPDITGFTRGNIFSGKTLKAGTYTISLTVDGQVTPQSQWNISANGSTLVTAYIYSNTRNSITFTLSSDTTTLESYCNTDASVNIKEIMVEEGSIATSFAPYSNYCPIDGRTETSLVGCGTNIWGSERLADDIIAKVTGAVKDTTNKTIIFSAENANGKKLFTIPDKNKRYTVIFYGRNTNNNSRAVNMSFKYSDGSIRNIEFQLSGSDSYAIAYSEEGKILEGVFGYWGSQNTILYYDQCGLFEGVLTVDDFVPYVESNDLTIQFGEKVYGAKVELESGTATINMAIVDMGTLTWYLNATGQFYALSSPKGKSDLTGATVICSKYASRNAYRGSGDKVICIYGESNGYIWVKDSAYTDSTTFKTAMSGVQLCYELDTPRTIHLTPNEISLLEGVNNISTDGDSISLTYRDGKVATLGDLNGLVKKIADCEDVEITDLQASDVLVWDATAGKWKNQQSTNTHVYSTTEQVVGTWIDGSTLYEKTWILNYTAHTTAEHNISIDIHDLNVEVPIAINGFWRRCAGDGNKLYYHWGSEEPTYGQSWVRVDSENGYTNGKLAISIKSDGTDYQQVTIQYTKNNS